MTMEAFGNITLGWLFTALVAVGGVIVAFRTIDDPFRKRREMIDRHEEEIADLKQFVKKSSETDKVILKTLNAMVNHQIDGNGIERLRSVRDELQNKIIEK